MKANTLLVNCLSLMGQAISSTQFYIFGKKHCTQTGYYRHVKSYDKAFPVQTSSEILRDAESADGVDMDGKVVVITGYVRYHTHVCTHERWFGLLIQTSTLQYNTMLSVQSFQFFISVSFSQFSSFILTLNPHWQFQYWFDTFHWNIMYFKK